MTTSTQGNPNRAPSLHQRLAAIEAAIQPVKATGSNEYKKPALSIGDVEDALRPLFAEHRVLTRWRRKLLERMESRLWRAELVIRMTNADDPEDHFEEEWEDVGSNPSAAYSFTRKGYYKALFHLAEDEEEEGNRQTGDGRQTPAQDRRRLLRQWADQPDDAPPPAEQEASPPMTLAQQIAMVCRNVGIERTNLIKAVTGKERGRDLTREEAEEVLSQARFIERGLTQLREVDGEWSVLVVDQAQPSQLGILDGGATS